MPREEGAQRGQREAETRARRRQSQAEEQRFRE
jgi:hypothetical protein